MIYLFMTDLQLSNNIPDPGSPDEGCAESECGLISHVELYNNIIININLY